MEPGHMKNRAAKLTPADDDEDFKPGSDDAQGEDAETEAAGDGSASSSPGGAAKKIDELETQLKDKESKYRYLYADFENYKKRGQKERSELLKFGWEPVARELLEVADNLDRALSHVPEGTDKNLLAGLQMVAKQFKDTMAKQGVQVVETRNQAFDPNFHEAVSYEPSKLPAGSIVSEHGRGYTLHGRLLRPSRVTVSSGGGTGG